MKMAQRQYIEGTEPKIYIGHRVRKLSGGELFVSKKWHAEYTLEGRQHSKSLDTTNKAAAIRSAHALCQQLIVGTEVKRNKRISVTELKDAYLEFLTQRGRSEKTLVKYRFVLKEFADWWQKRNGRRASEVTESDLWAYKAWAKGEGKSDQTVADRLILVKQLFKWGSGKARLLATNELVDASIEEPPRTQQPCFTREQVSTLLQNASAYEMPMLATLAYAGLRVGELRDLRWEDVELDGDRAVLHIRRGGSNNTTKGKAPRSIPIQPTLRAILEKLPRTSERVFPRKPTKQYPEVGCPLNDRTLLKSLKKLCKKCGFPNWQDYKVHSFRHAFASMCARSRMSYKYALKWMGHKSSDILDMYVTMYDDAAAEAMKSIEYQD